MLIIAFSLSMLLAVPVMAETGGEDNRAGQETQIGQGEGQENAAGEDAQKELTPAEKEAAAVRQYGTFKGKNAKKIPVITYHMVVSGKQKRGGYRHSSLAVSKSTFDRQMKWLHKKGYRSINCEEMYLWHEGKIKLPKKSVLITFDDGAKGVADYALPVLKKYKMKGTSFIVGKRTYKNRSNSISYKRMKKIQKEYPDLEFQSHTYGLHNHSKKTYKRVLKDAARQSKHFDFEYLAYPYGQYNKGMIRAYKKSGIKMAFTYGVNDYATRKQDLYKIRRIKINGCGSFSDFTRWFR